MYPKLAIFTQKCGIFQLWTTIRPKIIVQRTFHHFYQITEIKTNNFYIHSLAILEKVFDINWHRAGKVSFLDTFQEKNNMKQKKYFLMDPLFMCSHKKSIYMGGTTRKSNSIFF